MPQISAAPRRTLLRARGLRAWRAVELPVMLALGAAAVVLGVLGFQELKGLERSSVPDSLYRTVQLFVLEFNAPRDVGNVPDELVVARLLAPFVVGYAAVRALIALLSERLGVVSLRFAKNHVVVAGLSDKGFRLAKAFRDTGVRVAVIEADRRNSAIGGCLERGIPVVKGDATDTAMLKRAGVIRAAYLVAAVGDDGRNVDIAFSAREVQRNVPGASLRAFVHLDDFELWRVLSARGLQAQHTSALRLECFNTFELGARLLLEAHSPFAAGSPNDTSSPRIGVVGTEGIGESVILHVGRLWCNARVDSAERLEISVLGSAASRDSRRLSERHPDLSSVCSLSAFDVDVTSSEFAESGGEDVASARFDIVYVCLADATAGLAASLVLDAVTRARCPIVFAVPEEDVGSAAYVADEHTFPNIHVFGILTRTMTPELVARSTHELLARANHEEYVAAERARGITPAENSSMAPWGRLPESLRDSNRHFADRISDKLEAAGCALVPAPLADSRRPRFAFSDQEAEPLAVMEHDGWMADLLADGWRFGPEKDPARKTHPSLVPWEELGEDDREKDRSAVRALPSVLARAGFEIVRVAGG